MGRPTKYKIGKVVLSSDGIKVKIVEKNGDKYTLQDAEGKQRIFHKRCFGGKGFYWHGRQARAYKKGFKKQLSCGVTVEVVDCTVTDVRTVKDSKGNTMDVSLCKFKKGVFRWPFPHPDNTLYKYKKGDKLKSVLGVELTVIDLLPNFEYVFKDALGNVASKYHTSIDADGLVTWKHYKRYPKRSYVYIAHLNNVPYYIGSGRKDRYKHCVSGTSHSFLLNQHFFCNPLKLEVYIYKEDLEEEEALKLEYDLILEHNPPYNLRTEENTFRPSGNAIPRD